MKKLLLILLVLYLGGCCLIDACAARDKPKVAPVETTDKPQTSLDEAAAKP